MLPEEESLFVSPHRPSPNRFALVKLSLIFLTAIALCAAILYTFLFIYLNTAPANFPLHTSITISKGSGAKEISTTLADAQVVRSPLALYLTLALWYDPSTIKASTYVFDRPLTTREIAEEITRGSFNNDLVRLTHFEGERATHLAERAKTTLTDFDEAEFLQLSVADEGRLFPETYFLPLTFSATDLHQLLLDTFEQRITPLQELIAASPLTLEQIIILASIIEREANSPESMKMISGILQARLAINMPLQVDASMEYILDKPLAELTTADLETDSPYNTYLYKGLPPTPIGNPGLAALRAVLEPTPSDYLFYITGSDGKFYYAKTFADHKINVSKYLR